MLPGANGRSARCGVRQGLRSGFMGDDVMSLVEATGTAVGGLGAVVAVAVAVRALRATRRGAVAQPLLQAFGELSASITALADRAVQLGALGRDGERQSRSLLAEDFRSLEVANSKIEFLAPSVSRKHLDYGQWLRDVTHNLAANLLQADEFADMARNSTDPGFPRLRPDWVDAADWQFLRRSLSFYSVQGIDHDLPAGALPRRVEPLDRWWGMRILRFRHEDPASVYSPTASYLVQNARLLEDFSREYLTPWAQTFLGKTLLGRSPRGVAPPRRGKSEKSIPVQACPAAP